MLVLPFCKSSLGSDHLVGEPPRTAGTVSGQSRTYQSMVGRHNKKGTNFRTKTTQWDGDLHLLEHLEGTKQENIQ